MTERTENLIVRLYGLAEFEWCEHHVNALDEDTIVVKGENEEWRSDQWTMLKSDYEIIKKCADALDKLDSSN